MSALCGACNDSDQLGEFAGDWYVDGERSYSGKATFCIGSKHRLSLATNQRLVSSTKGGAIWISARGTEIIAYEASPPAMIELEVACSHPGETTIWASARFFDSSGVTVNCIVCEPTGVAVLLDPSGDGVDSISTGMLTFRSPRNELTGYGAMRVPQEVTMQGGASERLTGVPIDTSELACGQTHPSGVITVCPPNVLETPPGTTYVVAAKLAGPVPAPGMDEDHHYIYAVVFDSDEQAANNWMPQAPYDFDYFQGTDRWYQVAWDPGAAAWSMTVSQVSANQAVSTVLSSARAIVAGDTITWLVPAQELPSQAPRYRVSVFGHDGSYSASDRGGDVSGADPTEPPIELPTELVIPL